MKDDHITLERNTDWWGGAPRLSKLIFRSIKDNSARFAELKAGTIQQADLAQTDLPGRRQGSEPHHLQDCLP